MFNRHFDVLDEMSLWNIFSGTNSISEYTWWGYQGPSQYKDCLYTNIVISIVKIRQSWDRLIFVMGISILVTYLYIDMVISIHE